MKYFLAVLFVVAGLSGAFAQAAGPEAQNVLIVKANAALAARNWQEAEGLLKQLAAMAPDRWDYQKGLGDAQGNLGRYQEAVATYDKAIALAEKHQGGAGDADKIKSELATMFVAKGNMLLKQKNNSAATAAYYRAVPLAANPAVAYFNICATFYNLGQSKEAMSACDKALAADPKMANAYFIKGSVMYGDGSIDKNGKFIVAPAALQALRTYLALEPNGPHAADVKEMLAAVPK